MSTTSPALVTPNQPIVPEPGQVVSVRGSTWAVARVQEQGLPRSPADEAVPGLQHAVTLQALDEDRLGEELRVVWQLEVGHTITPDQGLPGQLSPAGFDPPQMLAGFIDAMRWGAVTSADNRSFQAPFHSGATVEAYQLEPLRRALSASRTNLLLADDVGLGKTIEAGLVIQELLLRHRARTAIVVCPPSLALKWHDEMRDKFGLEFTIINTEKLREVRRAYGLHANPFELFPRVIVSLAWLPQVRAQRMLREVYAQAAQGKSRRFSFDILVVDEAHHVAPASPSVVGASRGYAVDTQRTIAVRELAGRCEHRLFLSATPHNGHSESFTALMEMIDSRRFSRGALLDPQALKDVTVRRLKTDLPNKGFQPRSVHPLPFCPENSEQDMFELLNKILLASAQANGRTQANDITAMLLKKRFLSSPWSFGTTLQQYRESRSGGRVITDLDYDEVLGEGSADDEEGLWEQAEATVIRAAKAADPLRSATPGELDQLVTWGLGYESRPDARLTALNAMLQAICRPGGHWSNERIVLFTEYAHTLGWAQRVLSQFGFAQVLEVIHGGTPAEERELIRQRFTADPATEPVRILLATDAAGEGIDLQRHCHRLVNLDIPFNPSRLEQRIGRIDRYGQTQQPQIYHFVPQSTATTYTADLDFMGRIAKKIARVAEDLGSVNEVISAEIQQHFAATKTTGKKAGENGNAIIADALKGGLKLSEQLTQLERGHTDDRARLHLEPENLRRVVDTAFALNHQPPLELIGDDRTDAPVFTVPRLSPSWQSCLAGLDTRLDPGVLRPVTFDDQAAAGRDDLVYLHLGHPLVRKAQRMLRSSLWSTDAALHRVTAVVVPSLPESFVAAVTRMVLVGRGGIRLHEEIFLAGMRLRGGRAMAQERAERMLDQALDGQLTPAGDQLRASLVAEWNADGSRLRTGLLDSMTRRAHTRQLRVTEQLTKRQQAETTRVTEIFAGFRVNLQQTLTKLATAESEAELLLFGDDQQRQRRRDIAAMRERLTSLDDEQDRELTAITQRYRDVKPHTSAAAVVFALTPADADSASQLAGAR